MFEQLTTPAFPSRRPQAKAPVESTAASKEENTEPLAMPASPEAATTENASLPSRHPQATAPVETTAASKEGQTEPLVMPASSEAAFYACEFKCGQKGTYEMIVDHEKTCSRNPVPRGSAYQDSYATNLLKM